MKTKIHHKNVNHMSKEKILLLLLPFWTPQIPPLGISCLKTFLQPQGYDVKAVDANINAGLSEFNRRYFEILEEIIPEEKRGNLYNVGEDVLRNHMMAHLNHEDGEKYSRLIKLLVEKIFFTSIEDADVLRLIEIIRDFYRYFENYMLDLLAAERPGVLGISVYQDTLAASLFAFKMAKEANPAIMTIMGGGIFSSDLAVGSPNFDFFLKKTPYIDKIIVGEGEILLLKLLEGRLPGSQKVFTADDIGREMLDLSTVDIPDFSDFGLQYYPYLSAYSSRSCPFQCSFCSETILWGKYRKKNALQVADELRQLTQKFGHQLFLMGESLLNPIVDDLADRLIKADMSIYWDGYLRAEKSVCDTGNTLRWRRGGLYRARLGLESGAPHVLELMGKKINPGQIKKAVASLAGAGIKTTTYWVVGHPGETEEDFLQTLDLLEEMKDDIYEAWCNPFYYYMNGQVNSEGWSEKSTLLFPGEAADMLLVQTWVLNCLPSREEAYSRMRRFVEHCRKLDIPNPYWLIDFYKADKRWQKLHLNAVPPLVEFKKNGNYIDENKRVESLVLARNKLKDEMNFGF